MAFAEKETDDVSQSNDQKGDASEVPPAAVAGTTSIYKKLMGELERAGVLDELRAAGKLPAKTKPTDGAGEK